MAMASQLLEKDPTIAVSQNSGAYLQVNAPTEHISVVNALLVSHGIKVYELTPTQETLEEAFLRLTVNG
jgi:hypothetical protein